MKLRKILLMCLATAMATTPVFASTLETNRVRETIDVRENEVDPYLNISGKVFQLSTSSWSTIATDNNLMSAYVEVTNNAQNPSWIMLRVLDEDGNIIDAPETGVEPGKTSSPLYIPHDSGTYTIEAKAGKAGKYTLTIKD